MSPFDRLKSSYTYCKSYCDSVNATTSQNQELLKYREPLSKSTRNRSRFWLLFIIPAKVQCQLSLLQAIFFGKHIHSSTASCGIHGILNITILKMPWLSESLVEEEQWTLKLPRLQLLERVPLKCGMMKLPQLW